MGQKIDDKKQGLVAAMGDANARVADGLAGLMRAYVAACEEEPNANTPWGLKSQELAAAIGERFPLDDEAIWCADLSGAGDDLPVYTCATILFGLDSNRISRICYETLPTTTTPVADGVSVVPVHGVEMLRHHLVGMWSPAIVLKTITVAVESGTIDAPCLPWCAIMLNAAQARITREGYDFTTVRVARCVVRSDMGAVRLGMHSLMQAFIGRMNPAETSIVSRVILAGNPSDLHLSRWIPLAHKMILHDPDSVCDELVARLDRLMPQIPMGDFRDRVLVMIRLVGPHHSRRIGDALAAFLNRALATDGFSVALAFVEYAFTAMHEAATTK